MVVAPFGCGFHAFGLGQSMRLRDHLSLTNSLDNRAATTRLSCLAQVR